MDVKNKGLLVGVQSCGWIHDENLAESFRLMKEWGFEAMVYDISGTVQDKAGDPGAFLEMTEEEIADYFKDFRIAAEQNGMVISHVYFEHPIEESDAKKQDTGYVESLQKSLIVCKCVNCPILVLPPVVFKNPETEKQENLRMYRSLIPAARKHGVKICLENTVRSTGGYHQHAIQGACADAAEAVWYIDTLNTEAGEELFGFCLDTGCANVTARDMERFIVTLGSRLKCVHISDNNGISDDHLIPYTQTLGQVDWQSFIVGLNRIGYEGALTFDVSRALLTFPEEVRPYAMKAIAAVGKCMRQSIEMDA